MSDHIPFAGEPCDCSWRKHKSEEVIFENKTFTLSFCDITIERKDFTTENKGWGIYLVNHKGTPDKGYVFNYCPWCGGKIRD